MSPFNIQDEFHLPNFTHQQLQELLAQYTDEVGQAFAPEMVDTLHRQTAGQPFLVNRFAQILTEEMDIPKSETITMEHFSKAHAQLLQEENANITHLLTNIRRDPRFIVDPENKFTFTRCPNSPLIRGVRGVGVSESVKVIMGFTIKVS